MAEEIKTLEKTRTVTIPMDKIRKLIGATYRDKITLVRINQMLMDVWTIGGRAAYEIRDDLLFTIVEPVDNPKRF